MTQESNDDISETILEAEESILRISEELGQMKTAAQLLDETGKRSQLLQDSVENLVVEIGSLVDLSGRVIDALRASEMRELLIEMRTALSQRMDGLREDLVENTQTTTERVGKDLQSALIQHIDKLGSEVTAGTESATGRAGAELRGALIQRIDILEKSITNGTQATTEQVGAELRGALVQRMDSLEKEFTSETSSDTGKILQRLNALETQVNEVRKLAEKASRLKGIIFRG